MLSHLGQVGLLFPLGRILNTNTSLVFIVSHFNDSITKDLKLVHLFSKVIIRVMGDSFYYINTSLI